MWHIVAIGYLFVAVMYSAAQPSITRALIYLVFWAVLPSLFTIFVIRIRRRNKRMKQAEAAPRPTNEESSRYTFSDGLYSYIIPPLSISEAFIF